MLTPQEIQETKFEKAVFGGYDMAQIDKFLDELLVDYSLLYKENAALKGKMRVLVDKIDEYRAVDEEMRKALYTAQVTAKEIIDKANIEARVILKNAEVEAQKRCESIDAEIYANAVKLKEMRDICSNYAQSIKSLLVKAADDIALTENKEIDELINKSISDSSLKNKVDCFEIELPKDIYTEHEPIAIVTPEVEEPTIEIDIKPQVEPEETSEVPVENCISINNEEDFSDDDANLFDINIIREVAENDENEDEEEEIVLRKPKFNFSDLKFGKNYKNQD